jgi:hypothetical protein
MVEQVGITLTLNSCKGETQQHLLEQFHDLVRSPTLVPHQYLKRIFGALQPQGSEVVVLTSHLPGLGKTEEIQRKAFSLRKMCVYIILQTIFIDSYW